MSHSFTFVHRQQQERTRTGRVKIFQGAMKFHQGNSRDCSEVIRGLSKPIFRGGNRVSSLTAPTRPDAEMPSILENF